MTEDEKQKAYFESVFDTEDPPKEKIEAALNRAHEIRQFEIRLYWQRSLFYWGFMVALLTVFFIIFQIKEKDIEILFFHFSLCLVGLFISCAWLYIEKGSRTWQSNWEYHIDFLENEITGRLHKSSIGISSEFLSLKNIHQTIICLFIIIWVLLNIFSGMKLHPEIIKEFGEKCLNLVNLWYLPILLIIFLLAYFFTGKLKCFHGYWRTSKKTRPFNAKDLKSKKVMLRTRELTDILDK